MNQTASYIRKFHANKFPVASYSSRNTTFLYRIVLCTKYNAREKKPEQKRGEVGADFKWWEEGRRVLGPEI